jgi:xanthine dehydrogenase accessory factor
METADHEVLRAACEWIEAGETVYLVTVAKTFGSSPRPPGSLLALRADSRFADGTETITAASLLHGPRLRPGVEARAARQGGRGCGFVGSVSGGCIEYDLAARLRDGRLPQKLPAAVTYGVTREEAQRFGLPCGGQLEVVVERIDAAAPLRGILARIEARECVTRRVCLETGEASLHPAGDEEEFFYDGRNLKKVFGPRWRLLLIGAGQLSRFTAQMGLALDYEVIVCDPRAEIAEQWKVEGTVLDARMPDDAVRALAHKRCAVLALMHDPKLDDLALMEALEGPAFYVGALGSHTNNDKRRKRLASFGVPPQQLARLHGPVGLPIGSKTPAEIALAALAGVTAARHGITLAAANAALATPRRARG